MRKTLAGLSLIVVLLAGLPAAAGAQAPRQLELTFHADGSVTLKAQNVPVREILAEWARRCGCHVVNGEMLQGGPLEIPLQFDRLPQQLVLDSLLRQAAGYVLTPRRAGSTSASNYETIFILATSTPSTTTYLPPEPAMMPAPMPTPGTPEDEIPPVIPERPEDRPLPPVPGGQPQPTNTPSVFVPFVPIGAPQSVPGGQTPGTVTPVPGMPTAPSPSPGPPPAPPGR